MNSIYGVTGLRIKTFCSSNNNDLDRYVNEFLNENNGNIVNILQSSDETSITVTVVYKVGK